MRDTLFIYLNSFQSVDGQAVYCWLLRDNIGNVRQQGEDSLAAIADLQPANANVTAILPATDAATYQAKIPSKVASNPKQAIKLVPFALEEQLAEDLDELHFALPAKTKPSAAADGLAAVATTVITKTKLQSWLNAFADAGLRVKTLIVDASCLPRPSSDQIAAVITPAYSMARNQQGMEISCGNNVFEQLLGLLGKPNEQRLKLQFFGFEQERAEALHDRLQQQGWEIHERGLWVQTQHELLKFLSKDTNNLKNQTNLLQGSYAQSSNIRSKLKPWILPAALLLLLAALWLGMKFAELSDLNAKVATLDQQIAQQFKQALPGRKHLPGKEEWLIKQALKGTAGNESKSASTMAVVEQLGKAIASFPDIQVVSINFRKGALDAKLSAESVNSVEALKAKLKALDRVTGEVTSVNAEGSRIDIKARLSANQ